MCINILYGACLSLSKSSGRPNRFDACKHVVHMFLEHVMDHNEELHTFRTYRFSAAFDSCFDLHPRPTVAHFISVLTDTTYHFLASCGEPTAYSHVIGLPSMERFVEDASNQYPYSEVSRSPALFHIASTEPLQFVVLVSSRRLIITSTFDTLPHSLKRHFHILIRMRQAYPLPPPVALLASHLDRSPDSWTAQFAAAPSPSTPIDWQVLLPNWKLRCRNYFFDLFSKKLPHSAAPSICDITCRMILLLLRTLKHSHYGGPFSHDTSDFRDAFATLYGRIPSTTFEGFSRLALESFIYLDAHHRCLLANRPRFNNPDTQLRHQHLHWPQDAAPADQSVVPLFPLGLGPAVSSQSRRQVRPSLQRG